MSQTTITLDLPDELAREAEAAGLLTPEAVTRLLRAEIGRRKHQRLHELMDALAAGDETPLSNDEVNAEIEAARAERRAARAGGA
jgi:Arc/MetJ family transcription regulator